MTYKALRRKADKHWVKIDDNFSLMIESNKPIIQDDQLDSLKLSHPKIDWSFYELVTVYSFAEDELPSIDKIMEKIEKAIKEHAPTSKWYTVDKMESIALQVIYWYKSQILKKPQP